MEFNEREWKGIDNPRVLDAMRKVPRERFVPADHRSRSSEEVALPIGKQQTISQPYIVALMTQSLNPEPHHRILEIGSGSGYQAAVLSELVKEVYSLEIIPALAEEAKNRLSQLGYKNVVIQRRDGYHGLPEKAPFDGILCAAAPKEVPPVLLEQLKVGGRLVIPVGERDNQSLKIIEKTSEEKIQVSQLIPVRFVPFTREKP